MAPSDQAIVDGLDTEGSVIYRQWSYAADQLSRVLTFYASLGSTTTAITALEKAIAELTKSLVTERDKWEKVVDKCITSNLDPNHVNKKLKDQYETARQRLISIDSQYADALQ